MKKTFKFAVVVKGNETPTFMDGETQGVIGTMEVTYDLTEEMYKSPLFANALLQKQSEILEEFVEVTIEEVE